MKDVWEEVDLSGLTQEAQVILAGVSPRHRRVAVMVAEGSRDPEIAADLEMSLETAKRDVHLLCQRFAVTSRVSLALRLKPRSGHLDLSVLTPAQRRAVQLMAQGKCDADIGAAMGIAAETAKLHLRKARARLGIKGCSRSKLALMVPA